MFQTAHDFVVSSSTALEMAEHLLGVLNTIVLNLPELELRSVRNAMGRSVTLADDLLCNLSISSAFEILTNDGTCAASLLVASYFLISLKASTSLGVNRPSMAAASFRTPCGGTRPSTVGSQFLWYSPSLTSPAQRTSTFPLPAFVANGDTIRCGYLSPIPWTRRLLLTILHSEDASPGYNVTASAHPRIGRPLSAFIDLDI